MATWQTYLTDHHDDYLAELIEFLSIPSVSTDSAHKADVQRAAEWTAARLSRAGVENVQVMPTGGHPLVYADWLHAPGKPTALVYGHFDVQPPDPLDEWVSPPFEPTLRDGRLYARGATDDKSNLFLPILAAEALLKTEGELPLNLKFLFEGEEEVGSKNLAAFVAAHKDLLAADLAINADTMQWSETKPALTIGLKGMCVMQLNVYGPNADLHSGLHGGAIQNPIHALVQLLDSMRGEDGKILVEGLYDDVRPLSDDDRAKIAAVPFDQDAYQAEHGVDACFGEAGYTPRENSWARPTLEVNGIWGGFQGEGSKTIIPREAHAKLSCRLVPDQQPDRVVELVRRHVKKHTPPGVRINITDIEAAAPAYLIPANHPANQIAHKVLQDVYGEEPYYVRLGGSIPVCTTFQDKLGIVSLSFGFSLPDERLHSPNEFFRVSTLNKGVRSNILLFKALAEDYQPA